MSVRFRLSCYAAFHGPADSGEVKQAKITGQFSFFGLPLGRVVISRPRQTALLLVQLSSPNGKPRLTLRRSESSSVSVSTLYTHERQFRGNCGSSGVASQRRSSARRKRANAELHCQSSASSTKSARTGLTDDTEPEKSGIRSILASSPCEFRCRSYTEPRTRFFFQKSFPD